MSKFAILDKYYAYALVNFDRDTVDNPTANQGDYREIKRLLDEITEKARELGMSIKGYPDFDKVKPNNFKYLTFGLTDEELANPMSLAEIEVCLEHYPLLADIKNLRFCGLEYIEDCFDVKCEDSEEFYEQNDMEIWYNSESAVKESYFDYLRYNAGLSEGCLSDGVSDTDLYSKMFNTSFYDLISAMEGNNIAYIEVGENKVYLPYFYTDGCKYLPNKELVDEKDMLAFYKAKKNSINNEKVTYEYAFKKHEAVGLYEPPSCDVIEKTKRVGDIVSVSSLICDYFSDLSDLCNQYSIYKEDKTNDRGGQTFEEADVFTVDEEQVEIG